MKYSCDRQLVCRVSVDKILGLDGAKQCDFAAPRPRALRTSAKNCTNLPAMGDSDFDAPLTDVRLEVDVAKLERYLASTVPDLASAGNLRIRQFGAHRRQLRPPCASSPPEPSAAGCRGSR